LTEIETSGVIVTVMLMMFLTISFVQRPVGDLKDLGDRHARELASAVRRKNRASRRSSTREAETGTPQPTVVAAQRGQSPPVA